MSYTLTVDGIDLHYHLAPGGVRAYAWGGCGERVEWETADEAEAWADARPVFCGDARVVEVDPPEPDDCGYDGP